ncbi:carbohydrate esterase family 4 protein [Gonapodya prolifera JEL478]|uniref:Carbohydrate esterase family 4 protein n=1 Tax=Gonapodya prolifera (strain JEL478) TaxID=1344416 RepID=A0A139ADL5_GONPJ|nr:carbohydrate esterase family 4 protein [Gonapodya prolifera JEL478]|eukprot:KXS14860.1 carbohydrate esterase family 4 protein [Gonapodya prolifera JEL478]
MRALFLALLPLLSLAARAAAVCDAAVGCVDLSLVPKTVVSVSFNTSRTAAILPISVIVVSNSPKNLVVEAYTSDGLHRLGKSNIHGVKTDEHPVTVAVHLRPDKILPFLVGTASEIQVTIRAWLTSDKHCSSAKKHSEESKTVTVIKAPPKLSPQTPIGSESVPKYSVPLVKRQRSCDTIHAAYVAGTAMTAQDYSDWTTWKCSTWYPGGIGSAPPPPATRSCDTIHAAYVSGTAMTAQDYSDWSTWNCNTWYPGGIGSAGTPPPPPPPPPPSGGSPCTNPSGGCIDTSSLPTSVSATAGQGAGLTITVLAWANTQKDLFVEFRKNGAIVSNYAYASLPAATSSSWSSVTVTLTFPAQTSGTFQFFVWLTAPGASWGGQTFNTLVSTSLSGGSSPPPLPPPPPPSGPGGSPAGAVLTTCKTPGTYALTFDDGPYIYTAGLKSILASYGIKATFFVNGNNWDSIYNYGDLLRDSIAQGHQIAMHGWSHCDFTLASCVYATEVDQLMGAIQSIIGKTPSYFRFPYGSYNSDSQNYVAGKGLRIVQWNLDTGDWQQPNKDDPTITLNTIYSSLNAVDSSYASFIPLEHDVWPTTAGATSNSWIWAGLSFIQSKGGTVSLRLRNVTVILREDTSEWDVSDDFQKRWSDLLDLCYWT